VRRLDALDFLGVSSRPSLAALRALLPPPAADGGDGFGWSEADVAALGGVRTLLAGDVCYDGVLADAFLRAAAFLMRAIEAADGAAEHDGAAGAPEAAAAPPRVVLLLALEKRFCFSLAAGGVAATGYSTFRRLVRADAGDDESGASDGEASGGGGKGEDASEPPLLAGRRIALRSVPHILGGYARTRELELWQLRLAAG